MKVVIVDDEPKAIELLKSYLAHFANLELVGTFRNGLKAFEFISKEEVELIFLDINMPHINGMSLARMIGKDTAVIFTTAYSEYAVESYEVEAVDYLLKPISLERFTRAVSKFLSDNDPMTVSFEDRLVLIKSGSKTYRIKSETINYIEKDGNYSTYYLDDNTKIVARESIAEMLNNLPADFLQVHKSFVVNKNKVSGIEKDTLDIDQLTIPIGASFKSDVVKALLNEWR